MGTVAVPPDLTTLKRAGLIARDIKLAHSVFALPFAVFGAFLARPADAPWGRFAAQLLLIIACMVCARTWAMLFNRLADRDIDAKNPRTARRIFASGTLSTRQGWTAALLAAALFIGATSLFWVLFGNPWPLVLSVPVLAWIAFYSLTKRFTALCHVFLGGALAASPLAAAIAVQPESILAWPPATPAIAWIAGMVLVWVAGFDIIYALQDVDFDRAQGLSSIPARLGPAGALWVSRALHAAALAALVFAGRSDGRLGWLYGAGVACVGVLLVTEHLILIKRGRAGLNMAFFTLNGVVSCVLGAAGCLDIVL
jgi:4-hydroxybenzoate polyprenyltransferase